MHIGAIDESATLGTSWLHRASPLAKLTCFVMLLAATMVSWNFLIIGSVTLVLAAAVRSSRVRPRLAFGLAAYPGIFALVFAIASAGDAMIGMVIIMKAFTAGLAAVTIVLTTPYPQIFAPIQKVVPTIVGDSLLMTYRSTFLLLEKLSNLLRAVKLRAGLDARRPVRAGRATAQALGGLLLYSFDLSQRDFDVMRVRGYQDRLVATIPSGESAARDAAMVIASLTMLAGSVLWRIEAAALNPFSWIVPVLPLVLFVIALLTPHRSHT